jgi:uncharacterized protein YcaQ
LLAVRTLTIDQARRLALAAQGFDRPRPARVQARHLRAAIGRLGLLQLDFVTVLLPSHYQVLFSRLGPYRRALLDDLVYRRREFTEQWAREASIVPMDCWPLLEHRRQRFRVQPRGFGPVLEREAAYVARVLAEVAERGALTADQLDHPEGMDRRVHSWFGTVPRVVLEAHFGRGLMAIAARRPNFARAYDLAERIVPEAHRLRRVDVHEAQRELLLRAARASGVAAAADLADYFRMPVRDARPRLSELVERGALRLVHVEGWREAAYLHPQARLPARVRACTLLAPFDPLIWFRRRTARLFGFDYRLEVFVPDEKRRWGAYVLPFLMGDRLVARVDVRTDRARRRLRVLAAFVEAHADPEAVAAALALELCTMARWLELTHVVVERRGGLARALGAAVRAVAR